MISYDLTYTGIYNSDVCIRQSYKDMRVPWCQLPFTSFFSTLQSFLQSFFHLISSCHPFLPTLYNRNLLFLTLSLILLFLSLPHTLVLSSSSSLIFHSRSHFTSPSPSPCLLLFLSIIDSFSYSLKLNCLAFYHTHSLTLFLSAPSYSPCPSRMSPW